MIRLLTEEEIQQEIQTIKEWKIINQSLIKQFVFKDFKSAMQFMNLVAEEAEKLDHHPDWMNSYNRVIVTLITHSKGGITQLDFMLARKMEEVREIVEKTNKS
jgi:4a-hydroxytetrahydrobiopterin dehydratase